MSVESPLDATFGVRFAEYVTSYEDYRKLRTKVNRSLLQLRKELGIVTADTKNYLEKEYTKKISAEDVSKDSRFATLLLLTAERDSLYSLELKSLIELSGKKRSSYKKVMASKSKRAVATSVKLLDAAKSSDPISQIELYVYSALLTGYYSIAKNRWDRAIHSYSVARCGLELLLDKCKKTEATNPKVEWTRLSAPIMDELIESLIDPSLQLASAQTGNPTRDVRAVARKHSHDRVCVHLEGAVAAIQAVDGNFVKPFEGEIVRTVEWRSHEAQVKNTEIAVKIQEINNTAAPADDDVSRWVEYFENASEKWLALVAMHTNDISKTDTADDSEASQDDAILLTYLNYNMLFLRLASVLKKPLSQGFDSLAVAKDDISHLLVCSRTLEDIKELPGVHNDEELCESLESLTRYVDTLRILKVAECYHCAGKLPEALKILLSCRDYTAPENFHKVSELPYSVVEPESAERLQKAIQIELVNVHAAAQHLKESWLSSPLVVDNVRKAPVGLDSFSAVTNVDKIGSIRPILSKPALFDLAFNYIGYSGNGQTLKVNEEAGDDKKKSRFFSLFGR